MRSRPTIPSTQNKLPHLRRPPLVLLQARSLSLLLRAIPPLPPSCGQRLCTSPRHRTLEEARTCLTASPAAGPAWLPARAVRLAGCCSLRAVLRAPSACSACWFYNPLASQASPGPDGQTAPRTASRSAPANIAEGRRGKTDRLAAPRRGHTHTHTRTGSREGELVRIRVPLRFSAVRAY